jgi:hypothetical protein
LSDVTVIVESPHRSDAFDTTSVGEPAGAGGFRFLTTMLRVSPGLMRRVGDSKPTGVTKQNSVRFALSVVVK